MIVSYDREKVKKLRESCQNTRPQNSVQILLYGLGLSIRPDYVIMTSILNDWSSPPKNRQNNNRKYTNNIKTKKIIFQRKQHRVLRSTHRFIIVNEWVTFIVSITEVHKITNFTFLSIVQLLLLARLCSLQPINSYRHISVHFLSQNVHQIRAHKHAYFHRYMAIFVMFLSTVFSYAASLLSVFTFLHFTKLYSMYFWYFILDLHAAFVISRIELLCFCVLSFCVRLFISHATVQVFMLQALPWILLHNDMFHSWTINYTWMLDNWQVLMPPSWSMPNLADCSSAVTLVCLKNFKK